jgi:hypothetical protein
MPGPASNLVPAKRGEPGPALRHGAYSLLRLAPRAREIRAELEELLPLRSDADSPALDLLSQCLSQVERAGVIIGALQVEETEAIRDGRKIDPATAATLQRLQQDWRGWIGKAQKLLDDLGLSPRSRVQLGLDVVRTQSAVEALQEHLERKRVANG